jgi:septum formation protein
MKKILNLVDRSGQNLKFILASASPQRKKLLTKAGFRFVIIPSKLKEPDPGNFHFKSVRNLVKTLAKKKAQEIARKFKNVPCVILGADTLVVCRGKILGKPKNEKHARHMLQELSGSWQMVITGLCMILNPQNLVKVDFAETQLLFKKLDEKEIRNLAKKNLDKSGSYAIQKINDRFVKKMNGDLDNVIGLPVRTVKKMLKRLRVKFN